MNLRLLIAAFVLPMLLVAPAWAQEGRPATREVHKTTTWLADGTKLKLKGKSATAGNRRANPTSRKGARMSGTATGPNAGLAVGDGPGGGTLMTPDKDLIENARSSADHSTLLAALKAAGLVETLKSAGPFTVFAPSNAAFDKLPAGPIPQWATPELRPTLTKLLTYHIVPGRLMVTDLKPGQVLTTVQGEQLTVLKKGHALTLKDATGGTATVTIPNRISSNGITHVIDTVLLPAK